MFVTAGAAESVRKHAFEKIRESRDIRRCEPFQVLIQRRDHLREDGADNLPALRCELHVNHSAIRGAAPAAKKLFGFEPVQHAGHRRAVHLAFACEARHRVGAREVDEDQRLPLHGREAERLHAPVDIADERREDLLDEPPHDPARLDNLGNGDFRGGSTHRRKISTGSRRSGRYFDTPAIFVKANNFVSPLRETDPSHFRATFDPQLCHKQCTDSSRRRHEVSPTTSTKTSSGRRSKESCLPLFARHSVREIVSRQRSEIQTEIASQMGAKLAGTGLILREVDMGKVDLPADFRAGIEKLLAEELETEKIRYTLQVKESQVRQTQLEARPTRCADSRPPKPPRRSR
jgi:hypothetical protein